MLFCKNHLLVHHCSWLWLNIFSPGLPLLGWWYTKSTCSVFLHEGWKRAVGVLSQVMMWEAWQPFPLMTLRRVLWRSLGGPSQACVTPAASDQCSNCLPSHHPRFEDTPVRPSRLSTPTKPAGHHGQITKGWQPWMLWPQRLFWWKLIMRYGKVRLFESDSAKCGCFSTSNEKQGILSAYRQAHIYTHDISIYSCINIFNSFCEEKCIAWMHCKSARWINVL